MNLPETKNPFTKGWIAGYNVPASVYMKQEHKRGSKEFVMSRSELCAFAECPSKWIRGGRSEKETSSTEWGSLIDCLLLTPDDFQNQFIIEPETYTITEMKCETCGTVSPKSKTCATCKSKRVPISTVKDWNNGADVCKLWKEKQNGKTPISRKDYENAEAAIARLKEDEAISEYVKCSDKQVLVTAEYHDAATGLVIPFKCLLDLVPWKEHVEYGKTLGDLKTTKDASPDEWDKAVYNWNYHIQAAIFMDAYVSATGEDRVDFRHVVQENSAPFEVALNIVCAEKVEKARAKYIYWLEKYAHCLATNRWPGLNDNETSGQTIINGWRVTKEIAYLDK